VRRFFGALLLTACAHSGHEGTRGILLDCDRPEANVFVDDFYLDHAAKWQQKPMPLRPGFHRVEITADGYYTFYGEVTVGETGFAPLVVRLRRTVD
jgi:hypothetical protein